MPIFSFSTSIMCKEATRNSVHPSLSSLSEFVSLAAIACRLRSDGKHPVIPTIGGKQVTGSSSAVFLLCTRATADAGDKNVTTHSTGFLQELP